MTPHPLLSEPTLATGGTFLVVIIIKLECTELSKSGWKLRKRYFQSAVHTPLELSPGKITAWSGLIEELRTNEIFSAFAILLCIIYQ